MRQRDEPLTSEDLTVCDEVLQRITEKHVATSRKRLASPTDSKLGSPRNDTPDIIVEIDPDPEPPMI
ncbi:hypothetical protein [Rhizobium sp. BK060]|uniref:hypothetical protein n=1 Tax=Rhizobium sp. BK060 TaxID=2587096 RepID=UPI0016155EAD|nr:hypothetical protein [Rhizobium sp. BK060]MBB3394017.1 hypothetical protein [Rhizobium sp. BK060]